mgnify:CR=1 FL=1
MKNARNILVVALLAISCLTALGIGVLSYNLNKSVLDNNQKLDDTFRNLNAVLIQTGLVASRIEDASRDLSDVAAAQKTYWNNISASTARLMITANATLNNINRAVESLDTLVKNTDDQVNAHLLPATEQTLNEAKKSLTLLGESVSIIGSGSQTTLEDLHNLLGNEEWQKALKNMSTVTSSAALASEQIAEASRQLPLIANSMEKIAKTTSKWQKFLIPISLVSLIWRTFF